ncbi:hypothetical protein PG997_014568 [Apiospora hydei]|uniref:Zn(2)-C6 fungal-type domain-containing protein n=1 Tax=Apiospora hydei TaxID=1337664 RepID=A0ABR1UU69_9PEZI
MSEAQEQPPQPGHPRPGQAQDQDEPRPAPGRGTVAFPPAISAAAQEDAHAPIRANRHGLSSAFVTDNSSRNNVGGLRRDTSLARSSSRSQATTTNTTNNITTTTTATTTTTTTPQTTFFGVPAGPRLHLQAESRPSADDDTRTYKIKEEQSIKGRERTSSELLSTPNTAATANVRTTTPTTANSPSAPTGTTTGTITAAIANTTVATDPPPTLSSVAHASASADTQRIANGAASSRPPTPTSRAMSNPPPPHQSGPPRQHIPYPAPTYASPMQYAYPASAGSSADVYRGSPTAASHAMSLPSMRTIDPLQHQQQQQQQQQHLQQQQHHQQQQQQQQQIAMAAPMGQMLQGMSYYPPPPLQLPGSFTAFPADGIPRYAIPPSDPRTVLASGRHKKEIKRRTKTGCLTCRKRRIKSNSSRPRRFVPPFAQSSPHLHLFPFTDESLVCVQCDEQHPVCKNCQKSKRDCMGYDPIFKQQQQQQHPTSIQPAPNNHPVPPSASVPSNGPPLPPPTAPPPVYNPAVMSATPANTISSNSMAKDGILRTEGIDLAPAPTLDPSLGMATTTSGTTIPGMHSMTTNIDQRPMSSVTPHLRGGGPALVSMHHSASQSPPLPPLPQQQQQQQPHLVALPPRTPKMPINQLVVMSGVSLPKLQASPSAALLNDVRGLLAEIYGPGLERFFESAWFTREQTLDMLMADKSTTDVLAAFLNTISSVGANEPPSLDYPATLEPLVVWKATLAYFADPSNQQMNAGRSLPPPDDIVEARNRLTILDALISGDVLGQNPLQPMLSEGDFHRLREFEFWFYLGEFLTIKSDPNYPMPPNREGILAKMRTVLDGRENRDVLYAIAIMRAYTSEFPADFERTLPAHLDESMPVSKLAVARKFIQDEAKVTGGTTNVVRCFSEIAARAFVTRAGSRRTTI